jgi:exopolyphosphatase / guanosine-5'-triphosphate,3'-diphosphate pyrophosphatase
VSRQPNGLAASHQQETQQVAVVDLGSNSWRVVVFTYSPGRWWKRTDELYETVRIGEGLGESGKLSKDAMHRGLETLGVFERFCRANGLSGERLHVIATSAIRDAANREKFLSNARKATGLKVEVLSAEDEARFGYVAAVNTSTLEAGVVVEIGGGSLQLVQVKDRRARRIESFPLGALRITEELLSGRGPAKKKELQKVRDKLRKELADSRALSDCDGRLLGMGGAARNLAAAAEPEVQGIDIGVQGYVITRERMAELVGELAHLPVSERGGVPGIKPGRGDIILAAALTLESILELGPFAGIEVTEAGMREGVFFARTFLGGPEPLFDDVRKAAVLNLARIYESDMPHCEHVAQLALQMHDSLVAGDVFKPGKAERELLWASAMLHDVGMTISYDDHHKHSKYLIVSAELPGFDPRERALIAQISRYHRKGAPKLGELAALSEADDQALLDRCAVILRLAEHLERGRDQAVLDARLRANGDGAELHLEAAGDLTLPRWSIDRYDDGKLFERVFGRRLVIG